MTQTRGLFLLCFYCEWVDEMMTISLFLPVHLLHPRAPASLTRPAADQRTVRWETATLPHCAVLQQFLEFLPIQFANRHRFDKIIRRSLSPWQCVLYILLLSYVSTRPFTRFNPCVLLVSPTLDWRTSFLQDYNNAYFVHSSPDQHPEGNLMSVGWYEDDSATLWRCCHGYSSWRLMVLSSRCLSERVFPPPQPIYLLAWWCLFTPC